MSTKLLLQNFNSLIQETNSTSALRTFILDMAIRGKLVKQNPRDEPAETLLEKITAQKEELIKEGKIKSSPVLPPIKENEIPFSIPNNWEWVRSGNILNLQYGKELPTDKRKEKGKYPAYGSNGIVGYCDEYLTCKPAIIIGRKGSAGAINIASTPSWTKDVAYYLVPPLCYEISFLSHTLAALNLERLGKGIKPGLNRNDFYILPVPVPPLREQKRIVTKVNKLMKLCDKLEAAQKARDNANRRLLESALSEMLSPQRNFTQSARFALSCLPKTTLRPDDIKAWRKNILDMAIRGKLVKQNPRDERAETLLEKIAIQKEKLIKEGKIKSSPALSPIKDNEIPFSIPDGWEWVKMGDVAFFNAGKTLHGSKNKGEYKKYLRTVNVRWFFVDFSDLKEMKFEEHEYEKYALKNGDALILEGGEAGRTAIWNYGKKDIYYQNHIHRARFMGGISPYYFAYAIYVDFHNRRLSNYCTGMTIKSISSQRLANYSFPLPPLAEQKRIVAKVNKLMKLCDMLEAELSAAQESRQALLRSVMKRAVSENH